MPDLMEFQYGIKKVALYVRKSREDEEAEKRGIDTIAEQLTEMTRFLERYDVIYDTFTEVASGEKISERPEFQKIINCITRGKDVHGGSGYQAIVVRALDRLSRGGGRDQEYIANLVQDYNIYIINKNSKIYDPQNPSDQKMIRMEGFFNHEFYREVNYLLTNGRTRAAESGYYPTGHAPYGYELHIFDGEKHPRLRPIPEQAKVVQKIFDYYCKGMGERAISTQLRRENIKSANDNYFAPKTLKTMLQNEQYIGSVVYGKTRLRKTDGKRVARPREEWIITPNAHEPIISEEQFNKVQEIMSGMKKKPPVPMDFSPNELAGLVRCDCGKLLIRNTSPYKYKKKDGTTTQYNRHFLICHNCEVHKTVYIKYYDVEERLLQVLQEKIELNPQDLQVEVENALVYHKKQTQTLSKQEILDKLQEEKELNLVAIDRLYDDRDRNKVGEAIFERQMKRREKELEEIEAKIQNIKQDIDLESEKNKKDFSLEEVKANITNILDVYKHLDKGQKNELLRNVFDEVTLHFKGRKPAKYDLTVQINYDLLLS